MHFNGNQFDLPYLTQKITALELNLSIDSFKGIDLYTADDEEIKKFAESIADSLMWLSDETGYYDIRISSFYYRKADEYGAGFKNRDELVESIIKEIMTMRKRQ